MSGFSDWLAQFQGSRRQPGSPGQPARRRNNVASGLRRPAPRVLEALEDRTVFATGVTASYAVTQDWNSGFQAQIQLANQQAAAMSNWQLTFDYAANITSIWDAKIVSHTGTHYVISGASYDKDIAGNSALSFGFIGSGSGTVAAPANMVVTSGSSGGTTNPPPATPPLPTLSIGDLTVNDGASGASAVLTISLSAASTKAVTVSYATADGTAKAGTDYKAASGMLTLAAGQSSAQITVAVLPETTAQADKTFSISLTSPGNATLSKAKATVTIHDTIVAPTSGNFQFQDTSDWGSGFTGQISLKNTSQQTINSWQLEFDFAGQISSIWDATLISHTGSHFVVKNAGWNATIAPGASASFGFNASPGGSPVTPTNYRLYDSTSGTSTGSVDHTPTPAADTALVNPNQALAINVLANDTDPDGDPLAVTAVTQPKHGSSVLNSNGTVTYTPTTGYTGGDAFSYTVSDGRGATASAAVALTVGTPAATTAWPTQVFAPYVDMTLYPTYNLVSTAQTQGIKFFTLAFITADSANKPAWGGYDSYEVNGGTFDMQLRQQVASLRAAGGDVMVSFGGAANQELAQVITSVPQLTAAYQSVITGYGLSHIDFDIEGAAVADHASIDRRSQALASLQQTAAANGQSLQVSFTLPALPTALTADGLYVLQSALRYGVQISDVNIMTMDYGDSAAPNPQGHMGDYAIQAANALFGQLKGLYGTTKTDAQLWQMVGVTPMIGVNDMTDEVFDEAAARQLVAFAQQTGMGRISMWSLNRDTAGTAKGYVDDTSSSVTQGAYDFSKIFETI